MLHKMKLQKKNVTILREAPSLDALDEEGTISE